MRIFLSLFLCCLAVPCAAQNANLIPNGDFEIESTQSPPPGWVMWGADQWKDPKNYTRDTTQAHSGKASLRIFHPANTAGYMISDLKTATIQPKKGMAYDISFWAKTDVPGPSSFGMFALTSINPLVTAPPLASRVLALNTQWKKFSFTIKEGFDFSSESGRYLTLNFNATPYGVNSIEKTLWLDDIVVTERQFGPTISSGISLSPLFSDGMVLQRQMPIPFWGEAKPGQKITIALNGKTTTAITNVDGKWNMHLPALEAGGPFEARFQPGTADAFSLRDVLVGDVWLASGQSNMEYPLAGWAPPDTPAGKRALDTVMSADDPQLRMFTVTRKATDEVQSNLIGVWRETTPFNAGSFSAAAYYFARELRRELKIPIGIIHSSYGGTPVQAWTRREVMEANPDFKPVLDDWQRTVSTYPTAKIAYDAKMVEWQVEADKAKAEGKPAPPKPSEPLGPTYQGRPSGLYNAMIAPLLSYAIKGAIWYQGENNAGGSGPLLYRKLFPAMIACWRRDWGQGNFPFLFVQLANFRKVQEQPVEANSWAEIREAQTSALALPNTGMASAIDLADSDNPGDIHPKNKWDVGKRLALAALAQVYNRKVPFSGPIYNSMSIEGNKIRIRFKHAQGLKARGEKLQGFAITGADKNWFWADARIDGDSVLLSNPQVTTPVAVRYGWADNPIGNLYNGADLPSTPFRTDQN
jgi:sialate O-acetylesterase